MKANAAAIAAILFGIAAPLSAQDAAVRVVVVFHGEPDAALVSRHGGSVIKKLAGGRAVVARVAPGGIAALRALSSVSYVEEDIACSIVQDRPTAKGKSAPVTVAQPAQAVPWGITRTYESCSVTAPRRSKR